MRIEVMPAIMSGRAGSRLWPLSVAGKPKQFHLLAGSQTMIQAAPARCQSKHNGLTFAVPVFIAGTEHEAIIREQMAAIGVMPPALILEPVARNTAANALLAALIAADIDSEALVLLLPADNVIADRAAFLDAVFDAAAVAKERLVPSLITPKWA